MFRPCNEQFPKKQAPVSLNQYDNAVTAAAALCEYILRHFESDSFSVTSFLTHIFLHNTVKLYETLNSLCCFEVVNVLGSVNVCWGIRWTLSYKKFSMAWLCDCFFFSTSMFSRASGIKEKNFMLHYEVRETAVLVLACVVLAGVVWVFKWNVSCEFLFLLVQCEWMALMMLSVSMLRLWRVHGNKLNWPIVANALHGWTWSCVFDCIPRRPPFLLSWKAGTVALHAPGALRRTPGGQNYY